MNVAILHFHLQPGGVTQVVKNQLRALQSVATAGAVKTILLVYGGSEEIDESAFQACWPEGQVQCQHLPMLSYDGAEVVAPERLTRDIETVLQSHLMTSKNTLLHVHNHSLGKNAALPVAVKQLAERGYALLLQIHDFAEDFRPANYRHLIERVSPNAAAELPARLYPQAEQIHYATLNRRDHDVLRLAGVTTERLHLLPNPVAPFEGLPAQETARTRLQEKLDIAPSRRFVLYPVRGIRRKNLGETLLWSAMYDQTTVGVTLSPRNPVERPSYERWRRLAKTLGLPILFDVGTVDGVSYLDNLSAADQILTTSVAEGFGMVFLEAWLAGRSLAGRDLPGITDDFRENGVDLSMLAASVRVPVDWVGRRVYLEDIRRACEHAMLEYGEELDAALLEPELASLIASDSTVDFGTLTSACQSRVLELVVGNRSARSELLELNQCFHLGDKPADHHVIARNAELIREHYSLAVSGRRLMGLYSEVMNSARCRADVLDDGKRILSSFLKPTRIRPIRFET